MIERYKKRLSPDKTYGVYIHIPFCKSKCAYCAFCSQTDMSVMRSYVDALVREIISSPARGGVVDTVYIGGGTPSCLYRGALKRIFFALRDTFVIPKSAELTVEANPESCTRLFLDECVYCGVNRVSMGLQSSDDNVLKNIGRIHTLNGYMSAVQLARAAGITNLSSDMIIGLPGQGMDDVRRTADVISSCCAHASVYALSVEKGTRLFDIGYEPDDDTVADMYDIARDLFTSRGFDRYEVSNFARQGMQSAHNKKYWECEPYLAFGAAAHGYDGKNMRYMHSDDIEEYISGRETEVVELTQKDRYNEYVMLRLRTETGIDIERIKSAVGVDITTYKASQLDILSKEGSVVCSDGRIYISPDKMFVMNGIIEQLMD